MKIVMVGPVYPYKSGIAHYTGLMCSSLCKEHEVHMISYSLQYPKFLFHSEQKDFENDTFRVDGTEYLINTTHPANWVSVARHIRKLHPDLVIFQWWHPYFAPCYCGMLRHLRRQKIMFLCHNTFPHARFPMDRLLTRSVLKKGDYFIVQSSQDEKDLYSIKPDARCRLTVHPTYNAYRQAGMSVSEARRQLNIEDSTPLLLFFGFVKEYKGLDYLIKAMPMVTSRIPDARLLIVGEFDSNRDRYDEEIRKCSASSNISVYDEFIPDKEVEKFFAASDLVVLPYRSATQSGIVQISYGFHKPVVVTNVGGLPEVVTEGKTGYIVEKEDPEALAAAIVRFFTEDADKDFASGIKAEEYKYSWDRMNEIVDDLCKTDRN